jgi:hypothetical protein
MAGSDCRGGAVVPWWRSGWRGTAAPHPAGEWWWWDLGVGSGTRRWFGYEREGRERERQKESHGCGLGKHPTRGPLIFLRKELVVLPNSFRPVRQEKERGMGVLRRELIVGLVMGVIFLVPILCLVSHQIPSKSHELTGLLQVRDWWELDLLIPHPKPLRIPKSFNQTINLNFQISYTLIPHYQLPPTKQAVSPLPSLSPHWLCIYFVNIEPGLMIILEIWSAPWLTRQKVNENPLS